MEGGGRVKTERIKIPMCSYNIIVISIGIIVPSAWILAMTFYDSLLFIFCPAVVAIELCLPLWLKPPWECNQKGISE